MKISINEVLSSALTTLLLYSGFFMDVGWAKNIGIFLVWINIAFFMIQFECTKCQKRHRIKELKIDPSKQFRCHYCSNISFTIKQRQVEKSMLKNSDNIIMKKNYIKKELRND